MLTLYGKPFPVLDDFSASIVLDIRTPEIIRKGTYISITDTGFDKILIKSTGQQVLVNGVDLERWLEDVTNQKLHTKFIHKALRTLILSACVAENKYRKNDNN